jgi:hypothetical protein
MPFDFSDGSDGGRGRTRVIRPTDSADAAMVGS